MRVYIVILLISSVRAAPEDDPRAVFSFHPKNLGIVNGDEATPHQFPYQVGLNVTSTDGSSLCGGSLISNNYVLTAAHCVTSVTSCQLIFGAQYIEQNEVTQVRQTSTEFIVHPQYNAHTISNDLALIKLRTPVDETDSIKIVKLSTGSDTYENEQGTVAGWGQVSDDRQVLSPTLQYITSEIMSNDVCKETNAAYNAIIDPTKLCLSGKSNGVNVSTCRGDSGGPLVANGVQVGIVSFGWKICEYGYPSVYARVNKYLDWIAANSDVSL